jgi:hypothetical protein
MRNAWIVTTKPIKRTETLGTFRSQHICTNEIILVPTPSNDPKRSELAHLLCRFRGSTTFPVRALLREQWSLKLVLGETFRMKQLLTHLLPRTTRFNKVHATFESFGIGKERRNRFSLGCGGASSILGVL